MRAWSILKGANMFAESTPDHKPVNDATRAFGDTVAEFGKLFPDGWSEDVLVDIERAFADIPDDGEAPPDERKPDPFIPEKSFDDDRQENVPRPDVGQAKTPDAVEEARPAKDAEEDADSNWWRGRTLSEDVLEMRGTYESCAAVLDARYTVAEGAHARVSEVKNLPLTGRQLVKRLSRFEYGPKDGRCILQGEVDASNRRTGENMVAHSIIMLDVDNGTPVDDVIAKVEASGLAALIYTTHSHLKTTSEVREKALVRWLSERGMTLKDDPADAGEQAIEWLRDYKRYHPSVLDGARYEDVKVIKGAKDAEREFIIEHNPMPKCRVLLFLKEKFAFPKGDARKARLADWSAKYAAVGDMLGLLYDTACSDASRIMFTPRTADAHAAAKGRIVFIAGNALHLDAVKVKDKAGSKSAGGTGKTAGGATNQRGTAGDLQTPGLMNFIKKYPDFRIKDWLETIAPQDIRPGKSDGDKMNFACPNEDAHSTHNPKDPAFYVQQGERGWKAACLHDSCQGMSERDRAWYLDALCHDYGVKSADELRPYSKKACAEDEARRNLPDLINKLGPESPPAEIRAVIRAIMTSGADELERAHWLGLIAKRTGMSKQTLQNTLKAALAAAGGDAASATAADGRPIIRRTGNADGAIAAAWCAVEGYNTTKPRLFRGAGGLARLVTDIEGDVSIETLEADTLSNELRKVAEWKQGEAVVDPFPNVVRDMLAEGDLESKGLPALLTVSRAPKFSETGELVLEPGYHPGLKSFYQPGAGLVVPPVSASPTGEEVERAKELILGDLLEGFAFREGADGDDKPAEGGTPSERRRLYGAASRANALALFLLPFCRAMINGATPFHLVNKRQPREGASLFTRLFGIVVAGAPLGTTTYVDTQELRKKITSYQMVGAEVFILDNLEGTVEGAELCSPITGDKRDDRVLGSNEVASAVIRWVWLGNGNNVQMSSEMAKRTCLITIDSGLAEPERRDDFKHADIEQWARENRGELIWAVLTIIQAWIVAGKPKDMGLRFGGFDDWYRTMHGIMKVIGVDGFMGNREDLTSEGTDSEKGEIVRFLTAWQRRYGQFWVRLGDPDKTPQPTLDPNDAGDEAGLLGMMDADELTLDEVDLSKGKKSCHSTLGKWLKTRGKGTFKIKEEDGRTVEVRIERRDGGKGGIRYRLKPVNGGDLLDPTGGNDAG